MNILLTNSCVSSDIKMIQSGRCQIRKNPGLGIWPPIDLSQIAAVIRNKAEAIEIFDYALLAFSEEQVISKIVDFNPSVIIVQTTTPTIRQDREFYCRIKAIVKNVVIIFWGLHVTVRPEDVLCPEIPFAVRNEPELTILEVVNNLKIKNKNYADIRSLSYWDDSRVFNNPDRGYNDLSLLPLPARDLLQNQRYVLPYNNEVFTIVEISRGCPYECIFCTAGIFYGRMTRFFPLERIVADIQEAITCGKIKNFIFLSDTFNIDNKFVKDLCNLIIDKQLEIKWMCNSRIDRLDEETLRLMNRAGCWLISSGIESGVDAVLKAAKKNIELERVETSVRLINSAGIKVLCYFIFGLPGESRNTIKQTMDFVKKSSCDFAYFYTPTPFPGTEFFKKAKEKKWLISEDWSRYMHGASDVIAYPELSAGEIQKAVISAYRSFYSNPGRIMREIGEIRDIRHFLARMKIALEVCKCWFFS